MNSNYFRYLRTESWKERRKELLEQADNECSECGGKATIIHHLKYDNLGEVILGVDVIAVCKDCHDRIHEDKNYEEYPNYKLGYGEYGEW